MTMSDVSLNMKVEIASVRNNVTRKGARRVSASWIQDAALRILTVLVNLLPEWWSNTQNDAGKYILVT